MDWTTLTFNLAGNGKTRRETLNGVDYLVVPAVMITEGVHAGSDGPLLYEGKELGKTPQVWNNKPAVVYHPTAGSATEPHVLAARGCGMLMNTTWRPGKRSAGTEGRLTTEVWFLEDRTRQLDERITNAITNNEVMEVSTGLYVDKDPTPGTHNGKKYTARVTNIRPDHLAILPDQKGACSVADGAGLLRNAAVEDQGAWLAYNRKFPAAKRKAMPKGEFAGPHRSFPIQTQEDVDNAARLIGHAEDPAAVKAHITAIAKRKGLKVPKAWQKATTNAEKSAKELHSSVGKAIKQHFAGKSGGGAEQSYYLVDLYPQSKAAIYAKGYGGSQDQHYHVTYTMDRKGNVSLGDEHEEVHPTTHYRKTDGAYVGNADKPVKENVMTKNQLVSGLIANSEDWEEEDRAMLMGLPDAKLQQLHDKAVANAEEDDDEGDDDEEEEKPPKKGKKKPAKNAATPADATTTNAAAAPLTVEAFLAQAPGPIRDVLQSGLVLHDQQRARFIQVIKNNKANRFTDEFLNQAPLEALENLAALAASPAPVANFGAPRSANFTGAGAGGAVHNAASILNHEEKPMETPAARMEAAFAARRAAASKN